MLIKSVTFQHAGFGVGPEVSDEQFNDTFVRWFKRQAIIEEELNELYERLAVQVMQGVASCEKLQRYNNKAISGWQFAQQIRTALIASGAQQIISVPPLPRPRLFADAVIERTVGGFPTLSVSLQCDAQGFPTSAVQINAPICPGAPSELPGVAGFGVLPAAAAGYAFIIFALGGASWLVSEAFSNWKNNTDEAVHNAAEADAAAATHAQDVLRERVADACFQEFVQALDPAQRNDLAILRQGRKECDDRAFVLIPPREPDVAPPGTGLLADLGTAAVLVGFGAVLLFGGFALYSRFK